jgi:hypothetical protein
MLGVGFLGRPLPAQVMDPGLRGNWSLDVAKSSFGPNGTPTSGMVNWTDHGWVFALAFPNGYVYADAVVLDHGCELIGVPKDYDCAIALVAPKHLRLTLKQAGEVRRVGDIELIDSNTTRAVHRVTPAGGSSYTETTIWTRVRE